VVLDILNDYGGFQTLGTTHSVTHPSTPESSVSRSTSNVPNEQIITAYIQM